MTSQSSSRRRASRLFQTAAFASVALVFAGCAAADDAQQAGAAVASDDVVTGASIREIGCRASSRTKTSEFHFRLSSDGQVHEGTVLRGSFKDSPDYRVDVSSVTKVGDRYLIEASEGDSRYQFSLSAAAFDARQPTELDAIAEDTNDPAILEAAGVNKFQCWLGSVTSPEISGDDATRLWAAMNVEPVKPNPGGATQVKVLAPNGFGGPFILRCWDTSGQDVCRIGVPALVTDAKDGHVVYDYDLASADAKVFAAGTYASNGVQLTCTDEGCHVKATVVDTFYPWVNE